MLFSQERVASSLNRWFEPVWESVRPVPLVRIDFGNGRVLTRTLHGNILSAVCTPDGLVVDALPGIYTEKVYFQRLNKLRLLAHLIQSRPAAERDAEVRAYHRREAETLTKQALAPLAGQLPYVTKGVIERPVERVVAVPVQHPAPEQPATLTAAEDVARWKTLEEDTRLNEQSRRLQIHNLLAGTGVVRPEKVTRPIYKDVLHADLDDPYLGLGEVLFANYPFAREDQAR